jgi:hypothetical protein
MEDMISINSMISRVVISLLYFNKNEFLERLSDWYFGVVKFETLFIVNAGFTEFFLEFEEIALEVEQISGVFGLVANLFTDFLD